MTSLLIYCNVYIFYLVVLSDSFTDSIVSSYNIAVLEITVGHWPFSNQFQHLADQNPFWSANFTVHFSFNGMAFNSLQNVVSLKKQPTNF